MRPYSEVKIVSQKYETNVFYLWVSLSDQGWRQWFIAKGSDYGVQAPLGVVAVHNKISTCHHGTLNCL